jgi:hypothetical protein
MDPIVRPNGTLSEKNKLLPFDQARERMARYIERGNLSERSDSSGQQSSREVAEQLAKVNRMGFLTHDSQAGDEGERATVQGLMRYDRACAFTQLLNRMGDKVAFITAEVPNGVREENIILTKTGDTMTLEEIYYKGWTAMNGPSSKDMQKSDAYMKPTRDVVNVVAFDPQWGRSIMAPDGLMKSIVAALEATKGPIVYKKPFGETPEGQAMLKADDERRAALLGVALPKKKRKKFSDD